jgi:hypothetical protein
MSIDFFYAHFFYNLKQVFAASCQEPSENVDSKERSVTRFTKFSSYLVARTSNLICISFFL